MGKTALTDIAVRALKAPASGQTTTWDKHSPVGVRVSQGGSKTFIVLVGSGKRQTIGKFGVLTLAEARSEARRIIAQKTLGLDLKPSAITFETALRLFLEENYLGKAPRTKQEVQRLLERHFLPAFRKKPLSEITDADVGEQLGRLSRVPSEQLHAFRALRTMLRWCTRPPRRFIPHSPLEGYRPPGQDKKGTRVLTDQELISVWNGATDAFGAMIRLIVLWGTRKGETARIQRSWADGDVLTIPGEYTKNGRAHAIPLLPMARAILDAQPHQGRYFFPGRWDGETHFHDGSWGKLKRELDKRSGVKNWKVRDLRRTFRSTVAKLRVPREIAELLLNHVTGANKSDLDEIYDRYEYLVEKKEALAKLETHLEAVLQHSL
jgi:integrase